MAVSRRAFLRGLAVAGTPTGTPTDYSSGNWVPLVWDKTNKKLYVYDFGSAAWVQA